MDHTPLNVGYMEEDMWHATDAGVPQGGVISPLLLNVALHGMEQALGSYYTPRGTFRGTYALVRYADDVAIFCPTHAEAMVAKTLLATMARTTWVALVRSQNPHPPSHRGF